MKTSLSGRGGRARERICSGFDSRFAPRLLAPVRAHREPGQHRPLAESDLTDRSGVVARHARGLTQQANDKTDALAAIAERRDGKLITFS